MMTQKELDAKNVIALIEEYRGNVSAVASKLHCARNTLYSFIRSHPTCQDALETARESMIDNVESVLYSQALAGQAWAVCFFLKTQAKHRGYVERYEATGKDAGPIQVEDVSLLDEERSSRIVAILDKARARRTGQTPDDATGGVQE